MTTVTTEFFSSLLNSLAGNFKLAVGTNGAILLNPYTDPSPAAAPAGCIATAKFDTTPAGTNVTATFTTSCVISPNANYVIYEINAFYFDTYSNRYEFLMAARDLSYSVGPPNSYTIGFKLVFNIAT